MEKVITLSISILLTLGCFAQRQELPFIIDPLLNEVYSEAEINDMKVNNPQKLFIENYNISEFCYVIDKLPAPEGEYIDKGELKTAVKKGQVCDYSQIIANKCVNRYNYNLEQNINRPVVYHLGNTGYYLVVHSSYHFEALKQARLEQYGYKL